LVDEDAIEDVKPDEELNMYTAGMDPTKGPVMLSARQVAAQKAAAAAMAQLHASQAAASQRQAPEKAPPRSQTPVNDSSDDDGPNGKDLVWSQSRHYWRPNKNKKPAAAVPARVSLPMSEPEPARQPTRLTYPANSDDEGMSEDQRRMVNLGKKMSKKGSKKPVPEAKASTPRKGQESPETKVSHPMETRQRASGAGSLRSGGGSGQTGTCVASGNPPKT
jgi:hypothetical protein